MLHYVAPLFKAIKPNVEHGMAMITKINPSTGLPFSNEEYVEFLKKVNTVNSSEICQNIARVTAAHLHSLFRKEYYKSDFQLITVEGATYSVNGTEMKGADIIQTIHQSLGPNAFKAFPAPIIRHISRCTITEVRTILNEANNRNLLSPTFITHQYHQKRAQAMVSENGGYDYAVKTPDEFTKGDWLNGFGEFPLFLVDVIKACQPPAEVVTREEKAERIYAPLHTLSRKLEYCTRGYFNLEEFLAAKVRK